MKRLIIAGLLIASAGLLARYDLWAEPEPKVAFSVTIKKPSYTELEENLVVNEITDEIAEEEYCDSLEYLACAVESEAAGEPIDGKKMVVDTILNRVDSADFPDTIREVIDQSNQFSVVSNGSINKVSPGQETWEAVLSEVENRTNSEVIFFRAGRYHDHGTPLVQIGKHYFSAK